VAVYVAYSDETGTPNPDGAFVVGGYVEPENEWPHFSKNWADNVLSSPPAIPYLHMVEIRSKKFRADHGLTDADGLAKVTAAVNTIRSDNHIRRYFGTVHRGGLKTVQERIEQSGFKYPPYLKDPDYMCFLAFARALVTDIATERSDVTQVNFMVAKKSPVTHHYQGFRDELKSWFQEFNPSLAPLIGDLIPVSMDSHMPLQAADCFLWHLQRSYAQNLSAEDEKNVDLLEQTPGGGTEWSVDMLFAFANSFKEKT
jgi:hypothetical protein